MTQDLKRLEDISKCIKVFKEVMETQNGKKYEY